MSWRLVVSFLGLSGSTFLGRFVHYHFRGEYRTPIAWVISQQLCFYTFCLLASAFAIGSRMIRPAQRTTLVTGICVLYLGASLFWCGAFAGALDRPYRFLLLSTCGLLGLLAPWSIEQLRSRWTRSNSIRFTP